PDISVITEKLDDTPSAPTRRAVTVEPTDTTAPRAGTGNVLAAGNAVTMRQTTFVFSAPGGSISVDRVSAGNGVVLLEGPRTVNEAVWWRIRTPGGSDGWVPQSTLTGSSAAPAVVATTPPDTSQAQQDPPQVVTSVPPVQLYAPGNVVTINQQTFVFNAPGSTISVDQVSASMAVTILQGPELAAEQQWFRVRTPGGSDGWVPARVLTP
ncbi:MAG: GW dipeptide domain-containing protein, partial [Chloroflexota bacterium]